MLYPAYANIILDVLNDPRARNSDLSPARRMLIVGAPETIRGVQRRLPSCTVVSTFGMSESSGCSTTHDLDDPLTVRSETVGCRSRASRRGSSTPTRWRYSGAGAGEIQLRGPLLCDGYYRDPEKTAATFLPDGWLRTGDQGQIDDTGRLAFMGRLRDIIRVGGENVSPVESRPT